MKPSIRIFYVLLVVILCTTGGRAQDAERAKATAQRAQTTRQAQALGWTLRHQSEHQTFEFQGLDTRQWPIYYAASNLASAKITRTNTLWADSSGVLRGEGMQIALWDAGLPRSTHQEFDVRVGIGDGSGLLSDHATHVAGTLVGKGTQPLAQGMAPSATLKAFDWNFDYFEMQDAASSGLLLSAHPYNQVAGWFLNTHQQRWEWHGDTTTSAHQDPNFGRYTEQTAQWDDLAYYYPQYLIVKAAGNDRGQSLPNGQPGHYVFDGNDWVYSTQPRPADGPYDCIPPVATAKNVLTIGAMQADPESDTLLNAQVLPFSGWGPTDDGRIKPDLVAPGAQLFSASNLSDDAYAYQSGTSMATGVVAGSLVLLQELHQSLHAGRAMQAATLKALAIHTAEAIGSVPIPNYQVGWGVLHTQRAANLLRADANRAQAYVGEHFFTDNRADTLRVRASGAPLTVTLAWHDRAAAPQEYLLNDTTSRLIQDLDVRLLLVGDTHTEITYPFVLDPAQPHLPPVRGDNTRDNVEKIYLETPAPDATYLLVVSGKSALTQSYSLVMSGGRPQAVAAFEPERLVWFANRPLTFFDRSFLPDFHRWDLDGDGQSDDTLANPVFVYQQPGLYTVSLKVSDESAFVRQIEILPAPLLPYTADFEVSGQGFYPQVLTPSFLPDAQRTWEWGSCDPQKPLFGDSALRTLVGTGSWHTSLVQDHGLFTRYALESPPFDLSGVENDLLFSFDFRAAFGEGAGMHVQYSTDRGLSWQLLGEALRQGPEDWYDDEMVPGLDYQPGWSLTSDTGQTPSIHYPSLLLNDFRGEPDFRMRFVVGTDYDSGPGVQLDNFQLILQETDPLPVRWLEFTAQVEQTDRVRLRWQTASEQFNAGFTVEMRTDPDTSFRALSFVEGAGTTAQPQRYDYLTAALPDGTYWFRLRQEDFDGKTDYSIPRRVRMGNTLAAVPFFQPNPAVHHTTLHFYLTSPQATTVVQLFDAVGRLQGQWQVKEASAGWQSFEIPAAQLPPGWYTCLVHNQIQSQRVALLRH